MVDILIIACLNINPRSVTFAKLFYVDDKDKRQESALFYHRNKHCKSNENSRKEEYSVCLNAYAAKIIENVQTIRNIKWKINTDKIMSRHV